MSELKACPFCNGENCTIQSSEDGFPLVPNCLFESKSFDEIVKKWQVRPIEDALRKENEELREALELISGECTNYTMTDCWHSPRTVDAEFGADRVCDACIANAAIAKARG